MLQIAQVILVLQQVSPLGLNSSSLPYRDHLVLFPMEDPVFTAVEVVEVQVLQLVLVELVLPRILLWVSPVLRERMLQVLVVMEVMELLVAPVELEAVASREVVVAVDRVEVLVVPARVGLVVMQLSPVEVEVVVPATPRAVPLTLVETVHLEVSTL